MLPPPNEFALQFVMLFEYVSAQQSLRTVVMTDVAGFTEIMRGNEPQTLPLLRSDMEVIRAHISRQGGEVIKVAGDGLLALFNSAPSAVKACIDAQEELACSTLKHRMAIHAGEVTISGGDAYGDAVNVCARLEAATAPGSVFASRMVIDLIHAQGLPAPSSLGKLQLKGIGNPLEVYSWGESPKRIRKSRKGAVVGSSVAAFLLVCGGYAYWQKQLQVHSPRSAYDRGRNLPRAPMTYSSTLNHGDNISSNSSNSVSADELMDQAYDEASQELEQFSAKKSEAIDKVDAKIVLEWLKTSSMGQREKGRLEIEHWNLIEVAIESGKAAAGKNASAKQILDALNKSTDPDLEIAKKAFAEEFRNSK